MPQVTPQRAISKPRRSWTLVAVLALCPAICCIGNPVPEPPNNRPDPIDLSEVVHEIVNPEDPSPTYAVRGDPGSVEPGHMIMVWNLEDDSDPAVAPADDDGSFLVEVGSEPEDVLRVQVSSEDGRSVPVDGQVPDGEGRLTAPSRSACVDIPLELALEGGAQAALELRHDCGAGVTINALRWRVGIAELSFDPVTPGMELDPSGYDVIVRAAPPSPVLEDILFVELEVDSIPERHPVTILGGLL